MSEDKTIERIVELIEKTVNEHDEAVLAAMAEVARYSAIEELIWGFVCLAGFVCFFLVTVRIFFIQKQSGSSDGEELFGVIPALGFLFGSASFLTDIWNWIALSDPMLWYAHQIVEKIL